MDLVGVGLVPKSKPHSIDHAPHSTLGPRVGERSNHWILGCEYRHLIVFIVSLEQYTVIKAPV